MKKLLILLIAFFIFIGCGYKPTIYYAKSAISGNVYVDVPIDINNAQNTVIIKDAINEIILSRFKANLVNQKALADTFVDGRLLKVSHDAISSDNLGFVKTYRTSVTIALNYQKKDSKKVYLKISNYYDYNVDNDSSLNEQKKQDAVRVAVQKAISDIFAKIAVTNYKE